MPSSVSWDSHHHSVSDVIVVWVELDENVPVTQDARGRDYQPTELVVAFTRIVRDGKIQRESEGPEWELTVEIRGRKILKSGRLSASDRVLWWLLEESAGTSWMVEAYHMAEARKDKIWEGAVQLHLDKAIDTR